MSWFCFGCQWANLEIKHETAAVFTFHIHHTVASSNKEVQGYLQLEASEWWVFISTLIDSARTCGNGIYEMLTISNSRGSFSCLWVKAHLVSHWLSEDHTGNGLRLMGCFVFERLMIKNIWMTNILMMVFTWAELTLSYRKLFHTVFSSLVMLKVTVS